MQNWPSFFGTGTIGVATDYELAKSTECGLKNHGVASGLDMENGCERVNFPNSLEKRS